MARRKRNRKKKQLDTRVFPVPFAGVVVLLAGIAMVYLYLGCRCEAIGRELKTLEQDREELSKKHLYESYRWTTTKSPRKLSGALRRHGLNMAWPTPRQIVRVSRSDLLDPAVGTGPEPMRVARLDRTVRNE